MKIQMTKDDTLANALGSLAYLSPHYAFDRRKTRDECEKCLHSPK